MSAIKIGATLLILALLAGSAAAATGPCSLLTSVEIESALRVKVTDTIPSITEFESSCLYKLGKDQLVLSYAPDPAKEPKVKSMQEDPFMSGPVGANRKDYGNIGCKITDASVVFSTNCDRYQPHWLHMAVQFHAPKHAASMDAVKSLLEKAAARFK